MGMTRKPGFVLAKLIQAKFAGKYVLSTGAPLGQMWGFFHRRSLTAGQTIISVTLDKQSSSLLEEQTR